MSQTLVVAASGDAETPVQTNTFGSRDDSLLNIPDPDTLGKCVDISTLSLEHTDDELSICCFCMGPLPDCPEQTRWDGTTDKIAANCSTVRLKGETIGAVHAVCMTKHVIEHTPNPGMLCPLCGYKHYEEGDIDTMLLLDQRGFESAYAHLKHMRADELTSWMMSKITDKTLGDWVARPRHALAQRESDAVLETLRVSDEVLQMRADLAARPQIPVRQTEVFIEGSDESEEE